MNQTFELNFARLAARLCLLTMAMGAMALFDACSPEEDLVRHDQGRGTLKKVSYKEFSKNSKLMTALAGATGTDPEGRLVSASDQSFSFDTGYALYYDDGDGHDSYTFHIKPRVPQARLENIVFNLNNNTEYYAYVVRYDITENQHQLLKNGGTPQLTKSQITINYLDDPDLIANIFGREYLITTLCFSETFIPAPRCSCEGHSYYDLLQGVVCTCGDGINFLPNQTLYSWTECTISGGSGGSSGGGGQSGGGGGSNPPSNPYDAQDPSIHGNTVNTVPVLEDDGSKKDPCEKVKDIKIKIPALQAQLETLVTKRNDTIEHGISQLDGTYSQIVHDSGVNAADAAVTLQHPGTLKFLFMAHTHCGPASSTYSIFSWSDLQTLGIFLNSNNIDSGQFVAYLATADDTYYALTIDDPAKFAKFFATKMDANFDPNITSKWVAAEQKYYDTWSNGGTPLIKENGSTVLDDQKNFLQMIKETNMGLTLMESNSTFTQFKKLDYNPKTNTVIPTNCN